jgi:hypothetical protein
MRFAKIAKLFVPLFLMVCLNICQVSVSKRWEPTTPSGWPEIIINAPQETIFQRMQNGFANYGLLLKKQEPGLAIFESSNQKTSFSENLHMEMTQGNYSSLGATAIARITINFIPVEEGVRVIMAEERIINPNKQQERSISYRGDKKNFEGGILALTQLKEELEGFNP